jgi:putative ABC transport system permease protein
MIGFLLKGLIRDKSRSRLPVIVVAIGVMLSVFLHAYITGLMSDMVEMTARFSTGHVKIMTKAYADNADQIPNDLALLHAGEFIDRLKKDFPELDWAARIKFGGLIDVPDTAGETRAQGPAMGMGIDLLSQHSREPDRLNLMKSVVRGMIPQKRGEVLLSEEFSQKLGVHPGDKVTLIGSTMEGGMAIHNFTVSGTVRFGTKAMDRGTIIADISDVQQALNMDDAVGEITGFFQKGYYDDDVAKAQLDRFNGMYASEKGAYRPVMMPLRDQEGLGMYVDMTKYMGVLVTVVFMIAMSLVLWNAGLLGGLRRYGEIGVRLAIGEEKGHVYRTMLYESVMIGIAGTVVGTAIGLFLSWLLQTYGISIGTFTKGSTSAVMMPEIIRARITPADYYIGFVPGVVSTVIGTALAGIGVYRRKTAQLFKELET